MPATSEPPGGIAGLPTGGVTDEILSRPAVQEAIQDLAKRRDVDTTEITVVGYASVTWPDGALGCPQPGMAYSQALVPGQQLVLVVGGEDRAPVSYHAGRQGSFRYCDDPQAPIDGGDGST
ncbi:MAG: hypothetical protein WA962_15140 [Ornithinimicrobium sp.]